jgi:hypothetical protein
MWGYLDVIKEVLARGTVSDSWSQLKLGPIGYRGATVSDSCSRIKLGPVGYRGAAVSYSWNTSDYSWSRIQ